MEQLRPGYHQHAGHVVFTRERLGLSFLSTPGLCRASLTSLILLLTSDPDRVHFERRHTFNVYSLFKSLSFLWIVQVLGLASTQVGDTVVRRGIVHCSQLVKLNLSRTRITDQGERRQPESSCVYIIHYNSQPLLIFFP